MIPIHRFVLTVLLGLSASCATGVQAQDEPPPFTADWESLSAHEEAPEWFRDAKFGIYFHWGVYSVPAFGSEWYPRNMHLTDRREYTHHVETYGEPTEFGYERFVPMFTAEKFDAEEWVGLFEEAGARFAGPVAEHHDGFSMWDSELTPWNAADRGPKRDITGELATALRKRGMKLITSFHHARNNLWLENGKWTGHYDGAKKDFPALLEDPERAILYGYLPREEFLEMWLGKLKEVIDGYQPDLIWFDSWLDEIPDEYQTTYLAYYFNRAREWKKDVVVTFKQQDLPREVAIDDYEKGRADRLTEYAWLTDDTISRGSWCFTENLRIKPTSEVVHVLIDIVSKNGQLLLNVSPQSDGTIPDDQREVLRGIGKWLGVNGEAIYETRPWVIFGEGPTRMKKGGHFVGTTAYSAADIRFTARGDALYATLLGVPENDVTIEALGSEAGLAGGEVRRVTLLGHEGDLPFTADESGLHVEFPPELPSRIALSLRIDGLQIAGFEPTNLDRIANGFWGKVKEPVVVRFRQERARLKAVDATLVGDQIGVEQKDRGESNIGFWDDPAEYVTWQVEFPEAGEYQVLGRIAAYQQGAFEIRIGEARLRGTAPVTGNWDQFEAVELGTIRVGAAGVQAVTVMPVAGEWVAMNLGFIELRR